MKIQSMCFKWKYLIVESLSSLWWSFVWEEENLWHTELEHYGFIINLYFDCNQNEDFMYHNLHNYNVHAKVIGHEGGK
jgi:hypothetical protein